MLSSAIRHYPASLSGAIWRRYLVQRPPMMRPCERRMEGWRIFSLVTRRIDASTASRRIRANAGERGRTRANTGERGRTRANEGEHGRTRANEGERGQTRANEGERGRTSVNI
jgi:hypothetical protein